LQVAEAGLVVGGITVVAGVLGSVGGATVAQSFEPRWGSRALLGVPAGFTVPGAIFLVAALAAGAACRTSTSSIASNVSGAGNNTGADGTTLSPESSDSSSSSDRSDSSSSSGGADGRSMAYLLLFVAQVCLWTQIAPIATVSVNAVPARLRARSACVSILVI
jgi:hypothetical protein